MCDSRFLTIATCRCLLRLRAVSTLFSTENRMSICLRVEIEHVCKPNKIISIHIIQVEILQKLKILLQLRSNVSTPSIFYNYVSIKSESLILISRQISVTFSLEYYAQRLKIYCILRLNVATVDISKLNKIQLDLMNLRFSCRRADGYFRYA